MSPSTTTFPSELEGDESGTFALAGRVLRIEGTSVVVSDAFASVRVERVAEPVEAGDLVVLLVSRTAQALICEKVRDRHVPKKPPTFEHAEAGETARLCTFGVGARLADRAHALRIVRRYFAGHRFLEVDTPSLVPSPGLDLHLDAIEAEGAYLTTSPEYQMKRLLVGGVPRLFQIAHAFRRGERGSHHNPEFSLLEWYRAYAVIDEVIADTEQLVHEIATALTGGAKIVTGKATVDTSPPYPRLPVAEAFVRFGAAGSTEEALTLAERDEETFYRKMVELVEPRLAEEGRPIFLVDYPISQASLARRAQHDPRVCERFELYLGGIELCNGFGELTCPIEQRARLSADQAKRRQMGKPVYPLDERFLRALEEGMPPSAGNALGIDRLVAVCLGESEIARVMSFPAAWV